MVTSQSQTQASAPPSRDVKPIIHATQPGDERKPLSVLQKQYSPSKQKPAPAATSPAQDGQTTATSPAAGQMAKSTIVSKKEPRRFHMSRLRMPLTKQGLGGAIIKSTGGRKFSPLFVELSKRKKLSAKMKSELRNSIADQDAKAEPSTPKRLKPPSPVRRQPPSSTVVATGVDQASKKPDLPASFFNQSDVDLDQLARDMDAWTLESIGHNLARANEPNHSSPAQSPSTRSSPVRASESAPAAGQPMRFKPKAPAKRWAERNPKAAAQALAEQLADVNMEDSDGAGSESDEDDYVIETYVIMPNTTAVQDLPADDVGLLVFDNLPDVDYFYGDEEESDEEYEDDDDENGMPICE